MNSKNNVVQGLTPVQVVKELDRFIIGQKEAKKVVATALRNRERSKLVEGDIAKEIIPKNILMVGKTGVGKTEIARRLSNLVKAPFIKVEATKFTEVGYVGRDTDSIVRDLVDVSLQIVKQEKKDQHEKKAQETVKEKIVNIIFTANNEEELTKVEITRQLREGLIDSKEIEIEVSEKSKSFSPLGGSGGMDFSSAGAGTGNIVGVLGLGDLLGKSPLGSGASKKKKKKVTVLEALKILEEEEHENLIDEEEIVKEAVKRCSNEGIIFIDEIDKIISKSDSSGGSRGEVSREGVQRDLLPLIEGTTVSTKYGLVKTDFILFIASGAFYSAKPSDLLPELQARLPVRVDLDVLSEENMLSILRDTEHSLVKQYIALLATEQVTLQFSDDALQRIAYWSIHLNEYIENIGARRLHHLMELVIGDISFDIESYIGKTFVIDQDYVNKMITKSSIKPPELKRFIL